MLGYEESSQELSELATRLQPKPQQLIPHLSVTQSPAQPQDTHLSSALNSPYGPAQYEICFTCVHCP